MGLDALVFLKQPYKNLRLKHNNDKNQPISLKKHICTNKIISFLGKKTLVFYTFPLTENRTS